MEREGSLSSSKGLADGGYPEPDVSHAHPHILYFKINVNIIYFYVSQLVTFPKMFQIKLYIFYGMHPVVYLFDNGILRVSLHNNVLKHTKTK
jgi:hypothetical protein